MLRALRKEKVEVSEEKRSNLQKRGKIYKLCAPIKVRVVKSFRTRGFVICRSNISENFCF